MPETYILGHKNPDTDSIVSAICYSRLKKIKGEETVAARCGKTNTETEFVLNRFNLESPRLLEDATGKRIVLVDHNEYSQAVDGLRDADIVEVLDHHRIGDVQTSGPIDFHVEPVGSTSTLVAGRFMDSDVEMKEGTKGALLSGILSDTVLFRSPTSTERDEEQARRLADDLGLDVEEYGKKMFREKSKLGDKQPEEIVLGDFKEYEMGGGTVGIGQVETVTPGEVLDRQEEIVEAMERIVDERDYTFLLFLVTDLLNENSEAFFVGDKQEAFEEALDVKLENRTVFLGGVLSRKKQVVPPLENALKK